jgi:hypothetical protein
MSNEVHQTASAIAFHLLQVFANFGIRIIAGRADAGTTSAAGYPVSLESVMNGSPPNAT